MDQHNYSDDIVQVFTKLVIGDQSLNQHSIERGYKKVALLSHPDKKGGTEKREKNRKFLREKALEVATEKERKLRAESLPPYQELHPRLLGALTHVFPHIYFLTNISGEVDMEARELLGERYSNHLPDSPKDTREILEELYTQLGNADSTTNTSELLEWLKKHHLAADKDAEAKLICILPPTPVHLESLNEQFAKAKRLGIELLLGVLTPCRGYPSRWEHIKKYTDHPCWRIMKEHIRRIVYLNPAFQMVRSTPSGSIRPPQRFAITILESAPAGKAKLKKIYEKMPEELQLHPKLGTTDMPDIMVSYAVDSNMKDHIATCLTTLGLMVSDPVPCFSSSGHDRRFCIRGSVPLARKEEIPKLIEQMKSKCRAALVCSADLYDLPPTSLIWHGSVPRLLTSPAMRGLWTQAAPIDRTRIIIDTDTDATQWARTMREVNNASATQERRVNYRITYPDGAVFALPSPNYEARTRTAPGAHDTADQILVKTDRPLHVLGMVAEELVVTQLRSYGAVKVERLFSQRRFRGVLKATFGSFEAAKSCVNAIDHHYIENLSGEDILVLASSRFVTLQEDKRAVDTLDPLAVKFGSRSLVPALKDGSSAATNVAGTSASEASHPDGPKIAETEQKGEGTQ